MIRFQIENMDDVGHGIVLRLPLGIGVSFWRPWWRLLVGLALSDGCVEWNLGPFAGELWIDRDFPYDAQVEEQK